MTMRVLNFCPWRSEPTDRIRRVEANLYTYADAANFSAQAS